MQCLRKLLHMTYLDHIANEEVLKRAGSTRLQDIVAECRFRLAGYILSLPDHRHSKTAMRWTAASGTLEEVIQDQRHGEGHPKMTSSDAE